MAYGQFNDGIYKNCEGPGLNNPVKVNLADSSLFGKVKASLKRLNSRKSSGINNKMFFVIFINYFVIFKQKSVF